MNELVQVTVIEIRPDWYTVEFESGREDGTPGKLYVNRKWIPWAAFPVSKKGPARIPADVLGAGIEYSTVDLCANLGDDIPAIRICDLQDALRRSGLWTQDDYRTHPKIVTGVLQKLRGADTTTIINAALTEPKETTL